MIFLGLAGSSTISYAQADSTKHTLLSTPDTVISGSLNNKKDSSQQQSILLEEIIVSKKKGASQIEELQNLKEAYYKKQGIYYEGKPPIALLSPFGGKPITFFYELFGKNGRKARTKNEQIEREINILRVDTIFTDTLIRSITGIDSAEVAIFKNLYRPTWEEISNWSTYDLHLHIKKSFETYSHSR